MEKRYQTYFALQYMAKGTVSVAYDDETYNLSGAYVWPCAKGPLLRFEPGPSGSWEHRYIAFSGPLTAQWQASGLWPQLPQQVCSADFTQRFDTLLSLYKRDDYWAQQRSVNLLEGMLLELADERAAQPQRREVWLDDCLRHMSANHYQDNDYDQIAASWGMSLSTLRRRFKQQMGLSIHRYALQQRVALAQRSLRETDTPIKALADALGYSDVFFFSRQFKQLTGVTPGVYRRSKQIM